MTQIHILFSIITIYILSIYIYADSGKERGNSHSQSLMRKIIIIFIVFTTILALYSNERNYYKGLSTCKENTNTFNKKAIYRIISPAEKHEYYNQYILEPHASNMYTNNLDKDMGCNQILQTKSSVIYKTGDIIELTGRGKDGETITKNNTQSSNLNNKKESSFNYDEYIYYKYGADKIYSIYDSNSKKINTSSINISEYLREWRSQVVDKYYLYHDYKNAMLISGIVWGADITASADLKDNLRASGLSHIAVMSGYNVMIMSLIIYQLFKILKNILNKIKNSKVTYLNNLLSRKSIQYILILVILLTLPIINDFASPILRAYIFIFLATIYNLMGRVENYKNIFWITLIIIIAYSPHHALHDVGLHLSALAVGSLIYFEKYVRLFIVFILLKINKKLFNSKNVKDIDILKENIFIKYLSVTIAAQLLVTPYIIYLFGAWNPYSIINNLLIAFTLPLVTILGLIESFINSFNIHILSQTLAILSEILTSYMLKIINYKY